MKHYFLGIEFNSSSKGILIDEDKRITASAEVRGISPNKAFRLIMKRLESFIGDSFIIAGIGVCGKRRMQFTLNHEVNINSSFALSMAAFCCGCEYYYDGKLLVKNKSGITCDFFERDEGFGVRPDNSLIITDKNRSSYAAFGAALAAHKKFSDRNMIKYSASQFLGGSLSFRTVNCNGCKEHCVLSALMYNNDIKACFGAKCSRDNIAEHILS